MLLVSISTASAATLHGGGGNNVEISATYKLSQGFQYEMVWFVDLGLLFKNITIYRDGKIISKKTLTKADMGQVTMVLPGIKGGLIKIVGEKRDTYDKYDETDYYKNVLSEHAHFAGRPATQ